jgi:type IV pilus assembly protein PilV
VTSDPRRTPAEGGFTLIEVLVAMLILAVGLLGLEALGIGAARTIARADDQSQMTLLAGRVMEERMLDVRRAPGTVNTSMACAGDVETGLYVCSQVSTQATLPSVPANSARIAVTVQDAPDGPVRFNLVSHVFDSGLPPL